MVFLRRWRFLIYLNSVILPLRFTAASTSDRTLFQQFKFYLLHDLFSNMFAHSFFGKWAVELFCADDVENVATTKHFVFMGTISVHFEFCRRQLSSNRCFNTDSFSFVREKITLYFFHFSMNEKRLIWNMHDSFWSVALKISHWERYSEWWIALPRV